VHHRAREEFAKRNTKPIALSVDTLEAHEKWAPDIGEATGTALNFPIIADTERKVSQLHDMIHPGQGCDTSTCGRFSSSTRLTRCASR
jgi:alkyl hydroperoxide reductase subunit AhpC